MTSKYKFEKFDNPDFPVYSSVQLRKGVLVVPHFHKAAEFVKVELGRAEVIVNTNRIECKKGDIVFIPPYSLHSVSSIDGPARTTGIVYEFSIFGNAIANMDISRKLSKECDLKLVISPDDKRYQDLNRNFANCIKMYRDKTTYSLLDMMSGLCNLTSVMMSISADNKASNLDLKNDRIEMAIDYIQKNYYRKIYISELSEIVHVCDDHFIRLFKAFTNKSPAKYIRDKRVEEAMKLIANTSLSVSEIAEKVGFSNANYMTNTFKSTIEMTPNEYRKKHPKII